MRVAAAFGLARGDVVVSIHCGSRGLGHQIGTEFLREMAIAAPAHGIALPDRELACAPIHSELGQRYLGAMRAASIARSPTARSSPISRAGFSRSSSPTRLPLLFDVSHNTCKEEEHEIAGKRRAAVRAPQGRDARLRAGHPDLPPAFAAAGQPVLIGGSMGTASAIMVGPALRPEHAFASACHGAGRRLSRHQALKQWHGRQVVDELAARGIIIRSPRCAASPKRRPAPTRTSRRSSTPPIRGPRAQGRDARARDLHQGLETVSGK